jgi:hypothetical protein
LLTFAGIVRRYKKSSALFAALLVLSLVSWFTLASRNRSAPNKLAVILVGLTNNPTRTMGPPPVEVCQGGTGLYALFLVTNITRNQFLWFKTAFVEQKTQGGWERLVPGNTLWSGVEGSLWMPSYSCLMAVAWPPGLSTNASWRLQVSYGREPSRFGILLNQKLEPMLGRELFHSGPEENKIASPEVSR